LKLQANFRKPGIEKLNLEFRSNIENSKNKSQNSNDPGTGSSAVMLPGLQSKDRWFVSRLVSANTTTNTGYGEKSDNAPAEGFLNGEDLTNLESSR
ncbi:25527_t:CDS:2, partial [Dentiscutata erythropus]